MSETQEYMILAGALEWRLLTSLSPAEKKDLGRNRIADVAEARTKLRTLPEPAATSPACQIFSRRSVHAAGGSTAYRGARTARRLDSVPRLVEDGALPDYIDDHISGAF